MKQELMEKVINGMSPEQKNNGEFALEILKVNKDAFETLMDSSDLKNNVDFAKKAMQSENAGEIYDYLDPSVKNDESFILSTLEALNGEKENTLKADIEEVKEEEPVYNTEEQAVVASDPAFDTNATIDTNTVMDDTSNMKNNTPQEMPPLEGQEIATDFSYNGASDVQISAPSDDIISSIPTLNADMLGATASEEAQVMPETNTEIDLNEAYNNPAYGVPESEDQMLR